MAQKPRKPKASQTEDSAHEEHAQPPKAPGRTSHRSIEDARKIVSGEEVAPTDLQAAMQDWQPDENGDHPADKIHDAAEAAAKADEEGPVTFVADPFGISTPEISEEQGKTDELDLDEEVIGEDQEDSAEMSAEGEAAAHPEIEIEEEEEELKLMVDPEQIEEQLSGLASAMAEEQSKQEKELEAMTADQAQESADLLARQLAEDEALQEQLQREAEGLEEEMDEELQAALPSLPEPDASGNLDLSEMESCIEALLFMSDKPISAEKLQEHLGPDFPTEIFHEAIASLKAKYQEPRHGFELVEVGGGLQFRTKPGRAALAKKLAKVQTQRLSSGAMETLAIIAYRQPVLKDEIDKIRGVDSSHFVRGLLDKKLIRISGRSELPGRPMLYNTTPEFLELFGLKDLDAMPSLRELEQMVPSSQTKSPEDEDPRVKEMRRLVGEMKANSQSILNYDPREDEKILKEIRERVNSIPTSTPSIEEQKAADKAAIEAAKNPPELRPGEQATLALEPEEQPVIPQSIEEPILPLQPE